MRSRKGTHYDLNKYIILYTTDILQKMTTKILTEKLAGYVFPSQASREDGIQAIHFLGQVFDANEPSSEADLLFGSSLGLAIVAGQDQFFDVVSIWTKRYMENPIVGEHLLSAANHTMVFVYLAGIANEIIQGVGGFTQEGYDRLMEICRDPEVYKNIDG